MLSKVETFGCATALKDVPDADAADFAALLRNAVLSGLFSAVLAILGAEASTELEFFCVTGLTKLLVSNAFAFSCMRTSRSLATSAG